MSYLVTVSFFRMHHISIHHMLCMSVQSSICLTGKQVSHPTLYITARSEYFLAPAAITLIMWKGLMYALNTKGFQT